MSSPDGSGGGDAALIALLILLAARAIDWVLPKGWHLKLIHRFGEKDEENDDE